MFNIRTIAILGAMTASMASAQTPAKPTPAVLQGLEACQIVKIQLASARFRMEDITFVNMANASVLTAAQAQFNSKGLQIITAYNGTCVAFSSDMEVIEKLIDASITEVILGELRPVEKQAVLLGDDVL